MISLKFSSSPSLPVNSPRQPQYSTVHTNLILALAELIEDLSLSQIVASVTASMRLPSTVLLRSLLSTLY